MRCKQCGQELVKGAVVCPSCGTPVKKGNKTLLSVVLVLLFVILVSGVLVFWNLQTRGDLPEISFSTVKNLFVKDKSPAVEPAPVEEAEGTAPAEESGELPEETEAEPVPAEAEASVEEPEAAEPVEEAEPEKSVPTEEDVIPTAAENGALDADPDAAPSTTPLEAYREAEKANLVRTLAIWSVCGDNPAEALEQLKNGDAALLLKLCLGQLVGTDTAADLRLSGDSGLLLFPSNGAKHAESTLPDYLGNLLVSEEFPALAERYLDLFLRNVEDVTAGSGILEAEGILQTCTSYQVDFTADTVKRIVSSLIGELRWDEEVESILRAAAVSKGLDPSSEYDAFLALLDSVDDRNTRGVLFGADVFQMLLYVKEDGILCGRSLSWENGAWNFAAPQDGERFGLELGTNALGTWEISGRGTFTEGSLNGSFRVRGESEALGRLTAELG